MTLKYDGIMMTFWGGAGRWEVILLQSIPIFNSFHLMKRKLEFFLKYFQLKIQRKNKREVTTIEKSIQKKKTIIRVIPKLEKKRERVK